MFVSLVLKSKDVSNINILFEGNNLSDWAMSNKTVFFAIKILSSKFKSLMFTNSLAYYPSRIINVVAYCSRVTTNNNKEYFLV